MTVVSCGHARCTSHRRDLPEGGRGVHRASGMRVQRLERSAWLRSTEQAARKDGELSEA